MKLIKGQKQVDYFGIQVNVPYWCKYITTASNGYVEMHEVKPKIIGDTWYSPRRCETIAKVDLEGMDFQDTLMEIK